ncbi:hypothetical protein QZH41_007301 [Actinostola sp. cb2023]|nr:hypothetical protein QZH41_007301 [Actinostola sp. cb2023]
MGAGPNSELIVVSGFDRTSGRTVIVYDVKNLSQPLESVTLEVAPSILIPYYDEDTGVVMLSGKGDTVVYCFEVSPESPYLFELSPYRTTSPFQAVGFLDKRSVDVRSVEITRGVKLSKTNVELVQFKVPRIKGVVSQAPKEAPVAKKYNSTRELDEYKSDEQKKEMVMQTRVSTPAINNDGLRNFEIVVFKKHLFRRHAKFRQKFTISQRRSRVDQYGNEASIADKERTSNSNISNQEESVFENGPRKGNLKMRGDKTELDYLSSDLGTKVDEEEESRHKMVGKGIERGTSQQQILGISFPEALTRATLRTSNDQQLVDLMSEQKIDDEYYHASLKGLLLQFVDKNFERQYQNEGQYCTLLNPSVTTFASPKVNFFADVLLSNIVYIIISILCFVLFKPTIPVSKIILFPLALLIEVTLFVLNYARAFPQRFPQWVHPLVLYTSGWFPSHLFGAVLMCLPMASVFSNFMDCDLLDDDNTRQFFTYIVAVALLHFCNFTQLTSWIKTSLALVFTIAYVILLRFDSFCAFTPIANHSGNNTIVDDHHSLEKGRQMAKQVTVAVILLWVLVALLNRQLEIGVRRNFSGDAQAAKDKKKSQAHKEQVDWLLFSLFPKHVSDALKVSDHYSRNYDEVGVMFASIVNFADFYEENFEGGKECIRVLNELVGDFDELLDSIEFYEVEKIKTVNGSTFMAGSGLNTEGRVNKGAHPNEHLKQLVEFGLEMMNVVHRFNEHMLGFQFMLRIGYNAGPVTAGVIGTTKLLYDIWGDTVNLASRMDSTGVAFRIQVSETTKDKLSEFFTFSFRGTIPVKGKGYVTTYLLEGRIESGFLWKLRL